MVHAAAAIPQINWGLSLGTVWIAENPVTEPDCRDGMVYVSDKPGLGIEVDVKLLETLRPRGA
jgi:muconate cycloisomerase